ARTLEEQTALVASELTDRGKNRVMVIGVPLSFEKPPALRRGLLVDFKLFEHDGQDITLAQRFAAGKVRGNHQMPDHAVDLHSLNRRRSAFRPLAERAPWRPAPSSLPTCPRVHSSHPLFHPPQSSYGPIYTTHRCSDHGSKPWTPRPMPSLASP